MSEAESAAPDSSNGAANMRLFWACFVALVATSFVFGIRASSMGAVAADFGLNESQKGVIFGVGLWPFAISIIIFSLIIDKIGYKTAAYCAVGCHLVSLVLTVFATGYVTLFWGTFLVAIGNGIVEAFINPVVATAFSKQKAKWLNILHAGWPAGLALGALFSLALGDAPWKLQFGMCFIPVVIYALMIMPCKFPIQERVAAGVSYRDMLRQVGAVGFFIIGSLLVTGLVQLYIQSTGGEMHPKTTITYGLIAGVLFAIFGFVYTRSAGHWMFIVILLTMGPLATTELGTDSWMPELLKGVGLSPGGAVGVFIYVSILMTILRFFAGPIVHRFSPIGLLVISAAIAIGGLMFLSAASVKIIVIAATVYALGKTFLWSTTLGLVSEQFPKGGALTLNGVSAVGVLGMGIIGAPFMGVLLDKDVDATLAEEQPAIHQKIAGDARPTIFGDIPSLDAAAVGELSEADKAMVTSVQNTKKQASFAKIAVLPGFMLLCYLILFFYFRSKGGYKPVEIGTGAAADDSDPGF